MARLKFIPTSRSHVKNNRQVYGQSVSSRLNRTWLFEADRRTASIC